MSDSTWLSLQENLKKSLSADEFKTWIQPLRVRSEQDDRLVLEAPNDRFLDTLEASYRPLVNRAVAGLRGASFEVLFAVGSRDGHRDSAFKEAVHSARESSQNTDRQTTSSNHGSQSASRFNDRYRFDVFVVGSSNQFAYAAARAVAESPGQTYNPLFLYGGVGLGKTHLLHAIAQEITQREPGHRVLYLSAEQFVNELINSIRFDRMPAFRERYRTIDTLLVDDVQFFAGKERTQEEFFHTFNSLYARQKQIILSSDSPPKNIPTLEERLRSRFEWGLIADIQSPDLETKVAILRRKADLAGVHVPQIVGMFIAQQVKSNVRELEGLLNRVLAFASLTGRPVDLELAKETLRDIVPETTGRTTATEIIRSVAQHYGLKVSEIKSKNNSKQIAFPRQVAMYLCKRLTDLSYPEIGKQFNDKHHSTVMYSVDKIEKLRPKDPDLDRVLQQFTEQFGG